MLRRIADRVPSLGLCVLLLLSAFLRRGGCRLAVVAWTLHVARSISATFGFALTALAFTVDIAGGPSCAVALAPATRAFHAAIAAG